ncbi:MAG: hypothetical protein R2716_00300 [Microthrixaceae bacterium]
MKAFTDGSQESDAARAGLPKMLEALVTSKAERGIADELERMNGSRSASER